MEKKLVIIVAIIFVCTGLFLLTQKVQNSYFNNKVSAASQVKSKVAEVASKDSMKPSEKTVSPSSQSKTNTATDTAKQSTVVNKTVAKASEAPKVVSKPVTTPAVAATPKVVAVQSEDKGTFNFKILDAVNNRVIIEKNIDFNNVTIDYITCKILNEAGIKYINEGEGSSVSYFYSIAGLTERKAGSFSGWCFYVNGKKLGIGAGSCTYHKGDIVEWKYLKDALNN